MQPERVPDGGVQAVGRNDVTGRQLADVNREFVGAEVLRPARRAPHSQLLDAGGQGGVQDGAAHAQAVAGAEPGLGGTRTGGLQVADAVERTALGADPEAGQRPYRARHQALAAGLVDRRRAGLQDGGGQARPGGVDRGGQPGRAAADHQQVDHAAARQRVSAASSQRSRVASQTALSTVNPSAVTQAVCTRGSATPSATTAQ